MPYKDKQKLLEYQRIYNLTHRDKIREQRKKQRALPATMIKRAEYGDKYYRAHIMRITEYQARYQQLHPEQRKDSCKKYYQNHVDEIAQKSLQYRRLNTKKIKERGVLYVAYKTAKVPIVCKKLLAIKRAIKRNVLTASLLNAIRKGATYEAYI